MSTTRILLGIMATSESSTKIAGGPGRSSGSPAADALVDALCEAMLQRASLFDVARDLKCRVVDVIRLLGDAVAGGRISGFTAGVNAIVEAQVACMKVRAAGTLGAMLDVQANEPQVSPERARSLDLTRRAAISILRLNLREKSRERDGGGLHEPRRGESRNRSPWEEIARRGSSIRGVGQMRDAGNETSTPGARVRSAGGGSGGEQAGRSEAVESAQPNQPQERIDGATESKPQSSWHLKCTRESADVAPAGVGAATDSMNDHPP